MPRTIYALFFLCGMAWSASAGDPKPMSAIFLVAHASLSDPNFSESVVLVMNHIGRAPVGVIVNKPTSIPISRLFPELERLASLDDKLHFGGPVNPRTVSFLFRAAKPPENATQVFEDVYFSASVALLRELLGREKPTEGLRVFIGYSGWAPGQLEGEIARGDWTLAPADARAIFDGKSEHPWPERRHPGALRRAAMETPESAKEASG